MSFVCFVDGSVDRCGACACFDRIWECDHHFHFRRKVGALVEIRFKTRLSTSLLMWVSLCWLLAGLQRFLSSCLRPLPRWESFSLFGNCSDSKVDGNPAPSVDSHGLCLWPSPPWLLIVVGVSVLRALWLLSARVAGRLLRKGQLPPFARIFRGGCL